MMMVNSVETLFCVEVRTAKKEKQIRNLLCPKCEEKRNPEEDNGKEHTVKVKAG